MSTGDDFQTRWDAAARRARESGARGVEYNLGVGADGSYEYEVRVGDDWLPISEAEARTMGIWSDPRGEQFGVGDALATPEQLSARHEGRYDPRPASGQYVARRVNIRCRSCGTALAEVHDFEHRYLCHSLHDRRWSRNVTVAKCRDCSARIVDLGPVLAALDEARTDGKPKTVWVGRLGTASDVDSLTTRASGNDETQEPMR